MPESDLLVGITQVELIAYLKDAQAALLSGKEAIGYGAADSSGSFLLQLSPQKRIQLIARRLFTLTGDVQYRIGGNVAQARFV